MMRTMYAVTLTLFILAAASLSRAGKVTIMPARSPGENRGVGMIAARAGEDSMNTI